MHPHCLSSNDDHVVIVAFLRDVNVWFYIGWDEINVAHFYHSQGWVVFATAGTVAKTGNNLVVATFCRLLPAKTGQNRQKPTNVCLQQADFTLCVPLTQHG